MLTLLLAFLLLMEGSATSQTKCPDLSGRYIIQGQDGRVYITIRQTRCEKITIEWLILSYGGTSGTTHALTLDGRFHADTGWFGERGKRLTSTQFRSNVLEIVSKPNETKGDSMIWKQSFEMLPDKDLCIRFFDTSVDATTGSWSGSRAGRQKARDRVGEDEAARRSEEGMLICLWLMF
jgi:hypothetical protein